jgi:Family of unknown function (DUF5367)
MQTRLILTGAVIWIVATLGLRFAGPGLLRPGDWVRTIILFALSFALCAWLVRRLCQSSRLPREQWPAAAISVLLPTLLLDPFSSAFFPQVFPNLAPDAGGLFGGWMLICCAGGLIGVTIRGSKHEPSAPTSDR